MIRVLLVAVLFGLSACAVAEAQDPARGPLTLIDESTVRGPIEVIKCVGTGVSCTRSGRTGTMTISGGEPANMVTTDTTQTISGAKTLSAELASTKADGTNAITLVDGARIRWGSADSTRYLTEKVSTSALTYTGTLEANIINTTAGSITSFQSFIAGNAEEFKVSGGWFHDNSTTAGFTARTAITSSATREAFIISTANALTHDGAQLISAKSGANAQFKVDKDGSPVFNFQGGGSKPTCDAAHRGYVWRVQGGAGVADTLEWCAKDSADAYAWINIATPNA